MRKISLLVLVGVLFLSSCIATQKNISVTAIPSVAAPVTISPSAVATEVLVSNLVPKHNDLIFIEFFAVT